MNNPEPLKKYATFSNVKNIQKWNEMNAKYIGFLQYAKMPVFIIRLVLDWGVGFSLYELNKFNEEKNNAKHIINPIIPIKLSKLNKAYEGIKYSPTM